MNRCKKGKGKYGGEKARNKHERFIVWGVLFCWFPVLFCSCVTNVLLTCPSIDLCTFTCSPVLLCSLWSFFLFILSFLCLTFLFSFTCLFLFHGDREKYKDRSREGGKEGEKMSRLKKGNGGSWLNERRREVTKRRDEERHENRKWEQEEQEEKEELKKEVRMEVKERRRKEMRTR